MYAYYYAMLSGLGLELGLELGLRVGIRTKIRVRTRIRVSLCNEIRAFHGFDAMLRAMRSYAASCV